MYDNRIPLTLISNTFNSRNSLTPKQRPSTPCSIDLFGGSPKDSRISLESIDLLSRFTGGEESRLSDDLLGRDSETCLRDEKEEYVNEDIHEGNESNVEEKSCLINTSQISNMIEIEEYSENSVRLRELMNSSPEQDTLISRLRQRRLRKLEKRKSTPINPIIQDQPIRARRKRNIMKDESEYIIEKEMKVETEIKNEIIEEDQEEENIENQDDNESQSASTVNSSSSESAEIPSDSEDDSESDHSSQYVARRRRNLKSTKSVPLVKSNEWEESPEKLRDQIQTMIQDDVLQKCTVAQLRAACKLLFIKHTALKRKVDLLQALERYCSSECLMEHETKAKTERKVINCDVDSSTQLSEALPPEGGRKKRKLLQNVQHQGEW